MKSYNCHCESSERRRGNLKSHVLRLPRRYAPRNDKVVVENMERPAP
jgi:hypothetical protein